MNREGPFSVSFARICVSAVQPHHPDRRGTGTQGDGALMGHHGVGIVRLKSRICQAEKSAVSAGKFPFFSLRNRRRPPENPFSSLGPWPHPLCFAGALCAAASSSGISIMAGLILIHPSLWKSPALIRSCSPQRGGGLGGKLFNSIWEARDLDVPGVSRIDRQCPLHGAASAVVIRGL